MPTKNPWLNPYQRSFNSIKEQLRTAFQARIPEITDFSEGNIFMIIISIYAAIAEVLHYYIDNMARETFFSTARRYSSLYKHAKLVDYHIKSAIPASVDLTLFTTDGEDLGSSFTIPAGTVFTSADGKPWVVVAKDGIFWDKTLYPKAIKVPVLQKEKIGETHHINMGQILTYDNLAITIQGIPEGKYYVEGSMVLFVDGEQWTLVDTFAYYGPSDKVYKVELDGDLNPTIIFGDGNFGMLPTLRGIITGFFEVTYGASGNIADSMFTTVPTISGADTSNISVTNYKGASGGSDYENFSMLKDHVPLSVKTLGVAITKEDFEAVAKLVGGVDKAYAEYICGKEVRLYITPDNGTVEASQALINEVTNKLNSQKVITTSISVFGVHSAYICIDASVYGRKSFKTLDIKNQIITALQNAYGYGNSELGKPVRISDIYSLLDNLSTVDYLNLNRLYLFPNPVLISSASSTSISPDLNITSFDQRAYNSEDSMVNVYIEIISGGFKLYVGRNEEVFAGTFGTTTHVQTNEVDFYLTLASANYNTGDRYWFYIGPMNQNLEAETQGSYRYLPIFVNRSDTLILDINETV